MPVTAKTAPRLPAPAPGSSCLQPPDPLLLPDVAPDLAPLLWSGGVSGSGKAAESEPRSPASGDRPRPACPGPAHLVEHRSKDLLVAVHVDAPTDTQQLLLVLSLGLREGLQLDQQVSILQVPGARGPGGLRLLPAPPPPPRPWTDAQTSLSGARGPVAGTGGPTQESGPDGAWEGRSQLRGFPEPK